MMHQFFIKHINNKTPKTRHAKPDKIENTDFELSLSNPAHSEVFAIMKV